MNKKFCIYIAAAIAGMPTLFSCKPTNQASGPGSGLSESETIDGPNTRKQKPLPAVSMVESAAELKHELDAIAQGKDKSRVFESVLIQAERLDDASQRWDGTSTSLAKQFTFFCPGGNPNEEFFKKFGLVGHGSERKPTVEVEMLVRAIGTLASTRPELLQELLVRKSRDAKQGESDLVVYATALESVTEYSGRFRRSGYDGVKSLRESENPIYRLLAAKLMPVLEHDLDALAELYRPYLAEKDETILLAAISGLTTAGTSRALEMLRDIAATDHEDAPNVNAAAKRAVEMVAARQPGND